MTQLLCDLDRVDTLGEEKRGEAMPQVVGPASLEADRLGGLREGSGTPVPVGRVGSGPTAQHREDQFSLTRSA